MGGHPRVVCAMGILWKLCEILFFLHNYWKAWNDCHAIVFKLSEIFAKFDNVLRYFNCYKKSRNVILYCIVV